MVVLLSLAFIWYVYNQNAINFIDWKIFGPNFFFQVKGYFKKRKMILY